MTQAIDDVSALPGRTVHAQEMQSIGKVTHLYAVDGDGEPVWVAVEAKFGLFNKRTILIPLARLKEEHEELVVPYSLERIQATPELEGDEISEEDDRRLRDHYSIDAADQELRSDNSSYATLVPDEPVTAKRVEDPSSLETPDPDKRDDETYERLRDPGSAEAREIDAAEIANQATGGGSKAQGGAADEDSGDGEAGDDTSAERPTDQSSSEPGDKRERSGG
jgi:hypothetical protein